MLVTSFDKKNDVSAHGAHDIATEPQVIVQVCRFSLFDAVSKV